jgi:hypothetical protein
MRVDLTRSRRENAAFNYGFFRPNPLVFLRTAGENAGHVSYFTDFGVAEQTEIVQATRSGKQFRQDVSNKIHQAVTDHVGGQIAAPEIESGQD